MVRWERGGMVGDRLWGWHRSRCQNLDDDRLLLLGLLRLTTVGSALVLVRLSAPTALSSTAFSPGLAPFPLAGDRGVVPIPMLILVGPRLGVSSLLLPPLPAIIVVTHVLRTISIAFALSFGPDPCD